MTREEKRRQRHKSRRSDHSFVALPHYILNSAEFGQLSGWGVKLLFEIARHFKGDNNGDFSAAFSVLRDRGWNSSGTLAAAINELLSAGWIIRTRQGGRNRCALYAVTWWPVDECPGKWLEVKPEKTASHKWKTEYVVAMRCNVVDMRSSERRGKAA